MLHIESTRADIDNEMSPSGATISPERAVPEFRTGRADET